MPKTSYFGWLKNSTFKHKDKGNTVIIDNFSVRIGVEDYTQCLHNDVSKLLPDKGLIQERNQCSCDNKTNSYGRILLCNNHDLKVASGQTPGDRVGN